MSSTLRGTDDSRPFFVCMNVTAEFLQELNTELARSLVEDAAEQKGAVVVPGSIHETSRQPLAWCYAVCWACLVTRR